jgi:hypothetical protein
MGVRMMGGERAGGGRDEVDVDVGRWGESAREGERYVGVDVGEGVQVLVLVPVVDTPLVEFAAEGGDEIDRIISAGLAVAVGDDDGGVVVGADGEESDEMSLGGRREVLDAFVREGGSTGGPASVAGAAAVALISARLSVGLTTSVVVTSSSSFSDSASPLTWSFPSVSFTRVSAPPSFFSSPPAFSTLASSCTCSACFPPARSTTTSLSIPNISLNNLFSSINLAISASLSSAQSALPSVPA